MPDLSGRTIKGYELLSRLGEGAYGAVYRATQPQIKREVAIKIILPEYANRPDFIRRFEAEAQLVAQLEHMHIVPLYDYWREPGVAYLVMRLMKGGSLETSLGERGPWEPADAARLVDQIASALAAAHKQGVVHRDLKPANILLDEENNAYLSDFGIAKEMGAEAGVTQTGAIVGTPAYITPEQVQSQPVSAQTDIYSLGVVLYELLVGGHPFPDTPTGELVVKHLSEPLPYVREVNPELPAAVDGVIQRATSKDPESRYPDALSLAADLRRALDMEAEEPELPVAELINPYKGLRAFQEADADDFFGRDALVGQLLARLLEPGEGGRFLAVVGPSGSGKSSIVKAGLVPVLRKGALPGSDQWFITEMMPGAHPLEELERALMGIAVNPDLNLQEQLAKDSFGLLRAAWMALPSKESELLLVIDQFEELFILVEDESAREHFLKLLHSAVTDKESIVRVVVTLRADFYDRPLMYPEFSALMQTRTEVVIPLTAAELEQAVRAPAERVGAVLEKGLVAAITTDVAEQPGALPLLQYALTELFERREGRMLTGETYLSIGGVLGALGRRAEEVYGGLDKGGRDAARQMFLRLVTLGEGVEDTRRRVSRMELEGLISNQEVGGREQGIGDRGQGIGISEVIDAFGGARLLTFDRDPDTREPTVEVAHEALLNEWRRLREWLDESRADIRTQRVLGNAAMEWVETGRDAGFLLRGSRLDQFEAWAATSDLALIQVEQDYMDASLNERRAREAAEDERQAREAATERRSRNFLRGMVVVLAVAAIVAVVLSVFAFNQQGIAQDNAATAQAEALARATQQQVAEDETDARATQQKIAEDKEQARATQQALAEEARQEALVQASIGLGSQAIVELESSAPERSVLLGLEALEHYPYTWQAERSLGQAILNNRLRQVLSHDDYVNTAQWSSDGTKLLTAADDGTVRVWDSFSAEELLRITESGPVVAIWSPDEQYILAMNLDDNIVIVWDAESGLEHRTLDLTDIEADISLNTVGWNPWSPSGDRLLIYFSDGSVRIWDANTGEALQTLAGHQGWVSQAIWSHGGDMIASSGWEDDTVIVWQVEAGRALHTIPAGFDDERVLVVGWSPAGDRFTARGLGGVKVYDASTGRENLNLLVPQFWIMRVKWSPDGMLLLTSSRDGIARVWDAESGQELDRLEGLVQAFGIDWRTTGELTAVGAADGSVHLWDMTSGLEVDKIFTTMGNVMFAEFSPEGERLFAIGDSNAVNIFDLSEALISNPVTTNGYITNPAWSPNGEKFAFGMGPPDYPIKIWVSDSGEELLTLSGHEDLLIIVDWSPSGDRIVTTSEDTTSIIWDATSGEQLLTFNGHEDMVTIAKWSPDGSRIATGSYDTNVIIWDPITGDELITFSEHQDVVWSVAWSPDGTHILSTSDNGEAIIWESATGQVLLSLFPEDYNMALDPGAWTKDGERVVVLSQDGIVTVFDSQTGEQRSQFFTTSQVSGYFSLSPSDERIIVGSRDGIARVWDLTTGTQLLGYEVGGFNSVSYSPDGSYVLIGNTEGNKGSLQVFPTWHSAQELIDYAYECCVFRELTAEERELFGLPER